MFKNDYKRTMDGINPSDESINKTLDAIKNEGTNNRRFTKNTLKIIIAACLSAALCITSVFAFLRFGDNDSFGNSELIGIRRADGYDDIDAVVKDLYRIEIYDRLQDGITLGTKEDVALDMEIAPTQNSSSALGSNKNSFSSDKKDFSDTNNQVQGVQEADIVKTDGDYIYYVSVNSKTLYITEITGSDMNKISSVYINDDYVHEMLLLDDILCVITSDTHESRKTTCNYYDITNKEKPVLKNVLTQDGRYISSRAIGSDVYVITSYYEIVDGLLSKKSEIPEINGEKIEADCIWIPEKIDTPKFTVVTSYDAKRGNDDFSSAISVIGASDTIYSGKESLYLTNSQFNSEETGETGKNLPTMKTDIYRIRLGKNLFIDGSTRVPGTVLNQFSMDENNGKLRVATTIYFMNFSQDGKTVASRNERVNRVYCLDSDMKIIGTSADMGINEDIKSVRYIGNIAYVVTFRQTDPLYAVDLSDPTNPTILSELKIDGFSAYMQQFDENLLLGIGFDASKTGVLTGLKLTMFDVSDETNVKDISSYVMSWTGSTNSDTEAIYNHKAVLLSAKKNIIGIPLTLSGSSIELENGAASLDYKTVTYYTFFEYSDNKIIETKKVAIGNDWGYGSEIRGLYIDDYAYVAHDGGLICLSLENLNIASTLLYK